MIGHELGGRYQIIERIGGGGMALVYKAHDILLNRNIAIKVLRQQFVNDEEFIRRFRREAQSAASLSHPNVVSVYDVGQEDDIHYIVMEYVEGQNLNEIIKERAPLQVDEAIRIASQIADALDHAHHNQIIHRDIKPHNILIGRNGRVKVTDFGIARAVTSTTITQTGSVVGSVHYFSPEHAKGVATGEKSDLYSLGIVLYQMLTGRLPFLGESPISVALKHLQEHFEEPRSVNPMIPQSVENIILKSMRKNPGERYQSAKEMLHDLETCLLPERRMESKLSFIDEEDEDSTRIVPAIKPQVSSSARGGSKLSRDAQGDSDREEAASKRIWFKPVLWVSLTVLLLLAMAGVVWYVNKTFTVPDVTVPNVINLSEEDAVRTLQDKGLEVGDVKREYKEGFDEGIVYEQSRPDGAQVKEGAVIDLKVSIIKPPEKMPPLIGYTYDDAVAQLVEAGVDEDRITKSEEFSEMEVGKVIAQDPDAKADYDPSTDSIVLKVSKGVKEFNMPSLIDKTQEEAEATIKELGLKLAKDGIKTEPSFEYEAGKVIGQWPFAPNSLATPGTEMVLTVSSGYPPEAIKYTFEVPAAPVEEGKNSKIRIVYGDARGDNKEWGTKTINTTQTFAVELVLAPNKNGAVSVIRDGELFDTYLVSYIDAKQGTVPVPQLPGSSVEENSYNDWEEGEMENPDTGWIDNGAVAQAVKDNKSKNNGKGNGKGKDKDKDKDKGYK